MKATDMQRTVLLLVRHGETEDNVRHIMQGQTQGILTATGCRQAEALGRLMDQLQIDAFVASDLRRAVDTAQLIARSHGLPVTTTPLLRERDWGDFTGRYIPDLEAAAWPENVESMAHLLQRAQAFLDFIHDNYPGKCVLAVGHGIINKAIQAVFYKKPIREIPRMGNIDVRTLVLSSSRKAPATVIS